MIAQDIIDYANEGELNQLDVQVPQLLRFINLAVIELHTRFRLLAKEVLIETNTLTSIYTVPASDLSQIIGVTDSNGMSCVMNDYAYVNAMNDGGNTSISAYSIITPSYNQIQVVPKVVGLFSVSYSATPPQIQAVTDIINLPSTMTEALLNYIGYRAHGSYNADIKTENNTHYMRFEASCKKLIDLGYAPATAIDQIDIRNKGYI
jgi:hypothetical protein